MHIDIHIKNIDKINTFYIYAHCSHANSNNDLYRILYKLEKYKFNRSFDESYKIQEKFGKFIIENENPKITKTELLEYLKRKK